MRKGGALSEKLQAFKAQFPGAVSACVAVNPCTLSMFAGIQGMERPVRLQVTMPHRPAWEGGARHARPISTAAIAVPGPSSLSPPYPLPPPPCTLQTPSMRVELKLNQLFFSYFANWAPPAWRSSAAPAFWSLENPALPAALGRAQPLSALTTLTGRLFLGGSLAAGSSWIRLEGGASLDLGAQDSAWVLWRSEDRPAVSLRLGSAPSLRLSGGALALPLRSMPAIRGVDLLVRPQTSELWLSAQAQNIRIRNLAAAMRPLGTALERAFTDLYAPASGNAVTALDVHSAPGLGTSVRLRLAPGAFQLTAGAAAALGRTTLTEGFAVVLHAPRGSPAFTKVTLEVGGRAFPIPAA